MPTKIDVVLDKCDDLVNFYDNLPKFKSLFGYIAFKDMHLSLKEFHEKIKPEELENEALQEFVFSLFNNYIRKAFGKSHDLLSDDAKE
ncbi:MAG: hypothetical protein HRU09_05160 [Oligoflexales bacterium]|nr:hypothetical protein [Oligoflexales bacterium]